jgi:hypothetical protein
VIRRRVRPVSLLLFAVGSVVGCVTHKECRDGTVLLSFAFSGGAEQADALEVSVGYQEDQLSKLEPVPHRRGDITGTLELAVPTFAAHPQLVVQVIPRYGERAGPAVTKDVGLAGRGCAVVPFAISAGDVVEADAGEPDVSGHADTPSAETSGNGDTAGVETGRDAPGADADAPGADADASAVGPACTPACLIGQICNSGRCESACSGMQVLCKNGCADLASDPKNCGHCEMACKAGESCSKGSCLPACGPGEMNCGQACVDPSTDRSNCGSCGMRCAGAETCVSGGCKCATPNLVCSSGCINVINNRADCGSCGNACSGDLVCNGSTCGCPSGRYQCPNNALKCVISLDGCCSGGQSWCADRCTSIATDASNCGTCGRTCPGAQRCISGECGCPASQPHSCPGGVCLPAGTCCSSETRCADNTCAPPGTCCGSLSYCSGRCVNEQFDQNNCGGCGRPCAGGSYCTNGTCLQSDGSTSD